MGSVCTAVPLAETPQLGCPRNSVDTEFRLFFLLPSIPYSVRNWLKIPRNSAEFRVLFMYGIPYISKEAQKKVSSIFLVQKVGNDGHSWL